MRILTFSSYYTPEIAASMYLTEDLLEGMAGSGHMVDLYVPTPCRSVSEEVRKKYKHKFFEKKYDKKVSVHRFSLYKEGSNTLFRAIRYGVLSFQFFIHGLFAKKPDVIFAQSTPPTQGAIIGLLASVRKVPFVYNLQDVFPDSLVNTGMTSEGSLIWKIGRKVEDFGYSKASKIIVISEDFKTNLLKKGVTEEKIIVVPNWADVDGVYPVTRNNNKLIKKYSLDPACFYITYCGNIGFTQNMDMLLDVASELKEELPKLRFVLIGDGAAKVLVEERVKKENITNVILLPFQSYDDIAHVFSLGDVGLIISKPGVGTNSVPSKTWSIMAASKPILASFDADSELAKLIEKVNCGVCSKPDEKSDFITAIKYLMNSNLDNYGENGHTYVNFELSKNACIQKYLDVLEEYV